uniref:SCP domain-containing protein n=1 Tax=Strongyloides stercoralis TaxID=6248 RepID=A0AAF5DKZ9_STRER
MNLLFTILLLILFALQTHGYNYLAVPVTLIIKNHTRESFAYQGINFNSKEELIKNIRLRLKDVPKKYLLLHVIFKQFENSLIFLNSNKEFIRTNSNGLFQNIILQNLDFLIHLVFIKNRILFKCNGGIYNSYTSANQCMDEVKKYDKFKSQYKLIGKDENSKRIWYSIWKNCYYKCFSQNRFLNLVKKFIHELNKYRLLFQKKPLILSISLQNSAQNFAKKIANIEKYIGPQYMIYPANQIVTSISIPFANIQINKWYIDFLLLKKNPHKNTTKAKQLIGLFSENATQVGFGTYIKGKYLVLFIKSSYKKLNNKFTIFNIILILYNKNIISELYLNRMTYEYNYLAVPVTSTINNDGRESFAYQYTHYDSREKLIENIIMRFRDIPKKYLLIHVVAIRCRNMLNISNEHKNFLKTDSKPPFAYTNLPTSLDYIRLINNENKHQFECNSNYFSSYKNANKCMNDIQKYDKFKLQYKLIGNNWYGQMVWRSIWKDCYYKCFSKSSYQGFLVRAINEFNRYRASFLFKPVKYCYNLFFSAEKLAKKIAINRNKVNDQYFKIPVDAIVDHISIPFASIIVNKWYTEFLSLKKKNLEDEIKTKNLKELFSRYTTKIGFGIVKTGKYLIIVCMYK